MINKPVRGAIASLLITGIGAAASAAPSFHSPLHKALKSIQKDDESSLEQHDWALPSAIKSGLAHRGISFFGGDTYATYQVRKFESKQTQVKISPTDRLELYFGRQFTWAKGRSETSRFENNASSIGGRYVVKPPTEFDPTSWSVQYQMIRPDTADIRVGNSQELLAGTKNNLFAVSYGDRSQNQFQLGYTMIDSPAAINARSISLGVAHDYELGSNLVGRLEGFLVGQAFNGMNESSKFELKPIATAYLAATPISWLTFEGNVSAMPSGMPFSSGEFTGVSSFAVYTPGGIVNDLRSKFLAFGSLRVVAHWKF